MTPGRIIRLRLPFGLFFPNEWLAVRDAICNDRVLESGPDYIAEIRKPGTVS
jgi:hypothetical protein